MKTANIFIKYPLSFIESHACPMLVLTRYVSTGKTAYNCERLSQHYCYGLGWCPLRFTEPWFMPVLRKDGSGWRFY
jgi:hypothetical protein